MKTKQQPSEKEEKTTVYQCPMKCEGTKTYNQEGSCPVCNMKLMPMNSKNAQSQTHKCC